MQTLERREEKHMAMVVLQLKHGENGEDSDWVFASTMTYGDDEAPRAIRTAVDPYICWHLLLSQRAAAGRLLNQRNITCACVDRLRARSRNSHVPIAITVNDGHDVPMWRPLD